MTYTHYHEIDSNPETNRHLAEIVDSIRRSGWVGLPLLACGDQLLTGCHRATACEILGIEPEVHQMDLACTWGYDDCSDYLLEQLADARDSADLLRALQALRAADLVDQYSVDIMQAEYDKE